MSESKILAKVRGLLAKAEDPAATPAEAEAFSRKAEELIAKYAIDTALLEAKEHRGKPTLRSYDYPEPYGKAKAALLNGIAMAHGCKVVRTRRGDVEAAKAVTRLQVVGFESDLDLVEILYTSLLLQGTNALLHQISSDRSFRTSYWYSFAWRVSERLAEMRAKTIREETEAHGTSTALVLADRSTEVDHAYREAFPNVRRASSARVTSAAGYTAGRDAADRASFNQRGVGGHRRAIG